MERIRIYDGPQLWDMYDRIDSTDRAEGTPMPYVCFGNGDIFSVYPVMYILRHGFDGETVIKGFNIEGPIYTGVYERWVIKDLESMTQFIISHGGLVAFLKENYNPENAVQVREFSCI